MLDNLIDNKKLEKYNSITFPNFENFKVKYKIKDDKKELSNWCGKSIF